ncbi:MAG: maleylpyruvate isomerase family mycothiol-dependent enzyme [Propionibacteriaceae bacterium]|nr:maleylpyruvate isomerase family mycothiol-dependent enzyme [Propionibacteriaceae bacterium]
MADLRDVLAWVREGTDLFTRALGAEDDEHLAEESSLPGWTGADIVTHVSAQARAFAAALGAEAAEEGSGLRREYAESAAALDSVLGGRTRADWENTQVSVDGDQRAAAELPWLRARELMVHAVDLGEEIYFGDLPRAFLSELIEEVVAHRGAAGGSPALEVLGQDTGEAWVLPGAGSPVRVMAPVADLAAWLTGRNGANGAKVKVLGPGALPELAPWL